MADVGKASVLLVEIGPDPVRVPVLAPTKIGHWKGPLHRRSPNNQASIKRILMIMIICPTLMTVISTVDVSQTLRQREHRLLWQMNM